MNTYNKRIRFIFRSQNPKGYDYSHGAIIAIGGRVLSIGELASVYKKETGGCDFGRHLSASLFSRALLKSQPQVQLFE